MITIRRERAGDEAAVRAVQVAAFQINGDTPEEPVEAALLDNLRACDGWIPEFSWVAESDNRIVGHSVSTRGHVDRAACLGLGPIGVEPGLQRSGVGSALMHAMIGAADAAGEPLIALLGSPDYYSRFGFVPSTEVGIEPPEAQWGPFFQVRTLDAWSPTITGRFSYAAPFNELD